MGQHKVINRFKEKNHDGHVYEKGDAYPAPGKKLVKTRATFLTKPHATYGVAFLEEVKESTPPKQELEKPEDPTEKSDK